MKLKTSELTGGTEMKTYEVELRRTSFIVVTVEAENEADAEALAWDEINNRPTTDASWDIESIEEVAVPPQIETDFGK